MLATLLALAEPNRLRMLEILRRGASSVGRLAARLRLPQPQVSKHLRVMREAGLVDVRVDAQRRLYSLRPQALRELDRWLAPYLHGQRAQRAKTRPSRSRGSR